MATEREWVRNHRSSGFVAGRFAGTFNDQPRTMLVLQTLKGVEVIPEGSTIPITKEDVVGQATVDLQLIIQAIEEGGLSLDDAQVAWDRAMERERARERS